MTTTPTSGAADLRTTFSEILVDLPNTEPFTIFKAGFDAALAAGQATADPWRKAVTDACMPTEACFNGKDPSATINNLIDWHLQNERFHVAQRTQPAAQKGVTRTPC